MVRIIDRYILREICFPFIMSLFILTFVLLMGRILQLMDLMINKGVGVIDISRLVLYLMPPFLLITVPISLLIAILIGVGRLSADNEITTLKSAGMSISRIMLPIMGASIIAAIITAFIGLYFVPYGNTATRDLLFTIAKQKASIGIKEKVFNDDFKGLVLYADKIPLHGDYMEGVFISDNRLVKDPTTIVAEKGYLVSNPASMTVTLRLRNGSTHSVDSNLKTYKRMDFSSYDINLDLSSPMEKEGTGTDKKSREMNIQELLERSKKLDSSSALKRELVIEINKKFSIPLSCIVFAILGLPLSIGQVRSGKSRGFTVGLLVIMIYYVLQLGGEGLGETGRISPVIGTWAPNIILGITGIALFLMAVREKPITFDFIIKPIEKGIATIKNRWRRNS
ncbi:MAG TPA: LPS export ABC transporter permease LptF [Deltaproteobacteria bacterium]|nr:LPS export ABC transporter permease LptF [Deltaproteobacteria bacterium]